MSLEEDEKTRIALDEFFRGVQFRRLNRREFIALAGAGLGAATFGAWLGKTMEAAKAFAAPGETPQPGGTLTYALVSWDERFDPQATTFTQVAQMTQHICEPLIWEIPSGKFIPGLAESWRISGDGTTYTFRLRRGVKFTDGTPFTAEAVKFTMDRTQSQELVAGLARGQMGPYERTEIIDDYTVRIVMKSGYAPLMTNLNGYLGIVSPAAVRQMGLNRFLFNPVGTGPFMWKEYVANDHITLARNPAYRWGPFRNKGPAYLDQIIFKLIPQASVRVGALKTGEVQYIYTVDPLELEALKKDRRFVVIEAPQIGIAWTLLINFAERSDTGRLPITSDLAIRQAMCYGVDREGLNKAVWAGTYRPAWNPLSPLSWGYDQEAAKAYTYDPRRAREILEAAGWRLGADGIRTRGGQRLAVEIVYVSRPQDKAMSESIQASLRDVGIDVRLNPQEVTAARAAILRGNYDAVYTWTINGDPDALRAPFHSTGIFNRSRYRNPQVDAWLDQASATPSRAARIFLYSQVQRQIMRDAVCVPLAHSFLANAKRAEVVGDYTDGLGSTTLLHDTWIRKR